MSHGEGPLPEKGRCLEERLGRPFLACPGVVDHGDVAIVQGVLHHSDDPAATIREALRVAEEIVILEPNGLNPGLKLLEKVSSYHREHNERSYTRRRLRGWVEEAGARVVDEKFAIFVPIFSPDWLARGMRALEPVVESVPGLRAAGCSVYVLRGTR